MGKVAVGLMVAWFTAAGGCCTFGKRENAQQVMAARELTTRGLAALHRGECEEASRLLTRAAETTPEDPRIRRHLASSLAESGQTRRAAWELKQALVQCDTDPALYIELGTLLLADGEPHAAMEQAARAIELDRQLAEAWLLQGQCEMAIGQYARAIPSLHRATNCDADCAQAYLELAECWSRSGEPLRAMTALDLHNAQFATDQVPIRAVELTGHVLLDLGQHHRAARWLADASRRRDATRAVWAALIEAHHAAGDTVAAHQAAMSAQQLFPEDPEIRALASGSGTPGDDRRHAAR